MFYSDCVVRTYSRKGMHAIFQKKGKKGAKKIFRKGQKRAKYLKIWAKMYKN